MRLLPWISQQRFNPSYWAFSFGITALAVNAIVFILRGDQGLAALLAMPLFGLAKGVIAVLMIGTVGKGMRGTLLPPPLLS